MQNKFNVGDKIRWATAIPHIATTYIVLETPNEIGTQLYRIYDPRRNTATYQNSMEVDKGFVIQGNSDEQQ